MVAAAARASAGRRAPVLRRPTSTGRISSASTRTCPSAASRTASSASTASQVHLVMHFDNIQMIKEAVALGSGHQHSAGAHHAGRDRRRAAWWRFPWTRPELVRPLGIMHRRRKKFNRAMQCFLEMLQEHPEPALAR